MATFLLEVGTEELPADFVASALEQWRSRIPKSLDDHLLTPDRIQVFGTPRRLAVLIEGLPHQQPDQSEEIKGPPVKAAFKEGKPTQAAEGFARKQGVDVASLEVRTTEKGEFVFLQKTTQGKPVTELLPDLIPQWIFNLEGKRFMCWADGDLKFSRPIRWLVALVDEQILPLELANGSGRIKTDRISRGHRVLHPEPVVLEHAQTYVATLEAAAVQVDPQQRQSAIEHQIKGTAKELGGQATVPEHLLQEVTYLVEWPTAVAGQFEPEFLQLPSEVITTEMISHQRYFPVVRKVGKKEKDPTASSAPQPLLPYFITISNGDPAKSTLIAAGNERVVRARLSDGQFFYQADQSMPLADYLPQLEQVTFQEDLGSVRQKVERIQQNADHIARQLQLDTETQLLIQRAAQLCKADLVTQMVGEFPELQGVMGQKYAIASGEPEAIATAIFEHYLPRGANDDLPQTLCGQVVALADRLDTLVSIFGLGMLPTGSSDPFALRRAANAMVNIIWSAQLSLNLNQLLQEAAGAFTQIYAKSQPLDELQTQLQDFFLQRVRSLLQDELGIDYDLVNAVLGEADSAYAQRVLVDLLDGRDRAQFLQQLRADGTLDSIYETVNRATRLAKQGDLNTEVLDPTTVIEPNQFQQPSEQAFYDALVQLLPQTQAAQAQRDYQRLVQELVTIAPIVSCFFDGPDSVLVMAENLDLRRNRLYLLGLLRNHARVLADFGAIVKR